MDRNPQKKDIASKNFFKGHANGKFFIESTYQALQQGIFWKGLNPQTEGKVLEILFEISRWCHVLYCIHLIGNSIRHFNP